MKTMQGFPTHAKDGRSLAAQVGEFSEGEMR
jgi:hypothetical protein